MSSLEKSWLEKDKAKTQELVCLVFDALLHSNRMVDSDQATQLDGHFIDLQNCILKMVDHNGIREREFHKLVALIIGVIDHTTSDMFTEEQIHAIRKLTNHLSGTVTVLDLKECRYILRKAFLNPTRPLGGIFDPIDEDLLTEEQSLLYAIDVAEIVYDQITEALAGAIPNSKVESILQITEALIADEILEAADNWYNWHKMKVKKNENH